MAARWNENQTKAARLPARRQLKAPSRDTNPASVRGSSAGLLAMIPFYLVVGLAQQHLAGQLTRRIWFEYADIGGLGLAIALAYAFA